MNDPPDDESGLTLELPPGPARSLALAIKIAEGVLQNNVRDLASKGQRSQNTITLLAHLEMIQKVMGPLPAIVGKKLKAQSLSTETPITSPVPAPQTTWTLVILGHAYKVTLVTSSPIGPAMLFASALPPRIPEQVVLIRQDADKSTEKWLLTGMTSKGKYIVPSHCHTAG